MKRLINMTILIFNKELNIKKFIFKDCTKKSRLQNPIIYYSNI